MYTIEEIVENNLNGGTRLNKNIMKILNVKYVVTRGELKDPDLDLVYPVKGSNMYTYLFKGFKKRGFFVGNWIKIEDEYERVNALNSPSFNPDSLAITEEDISVPINFPDSSNVTITSFNPNQLRMNAYTDKQSLFVISEIYYPPGWKITVNGNEIDKIYRLNHAVQGIILPPGNHEVVLNFHPDSYYSDVRYAGISLIIIYLVIIGSVINYFIVRKKGSESPSA